MSIDARVTHVFKPEVRSQAIAIIEKDAIFLTSATDLQIEALVRATPPVRTQLKTTSISDATFSVRCSCPPYVKGQFCKHIWATLLLASEKAPDFFSQKTNIERSESPEETATGSSTQAATKKAPPRERTDYQEKMRLRANEARKEQYQRMKAKASARTRDGKQESRRSSAVTLPDEIQSAVTYFEQNGFSLGSPMDPEILRTAKKQLARIFHPDKGGTHEEILALNQNFDLLIDYIKSV